MARDYIPRPNVEFNDFQVRLVKAVVTNALTWKIPADEVATLQTDSARQADYFKAISNKNNRTKTQVEEHDQFRKTFEADLRLFVNSYLRSNKNVSTSDATGMGIKQRGKKRKQRTKILEAPVLFIYSRGGLRLHFAFRQLSQEGRGSIHAEADGLELRYVIGEKPKTEKDAPIHFFSSKAHFYMEFAEEHRGKKVYVFARWKNNVKETLSGPWCAVVEGMIF